MKNIVLFGPPGAGKGTQSALLVDEFALVHLSTGDIFRRNIREATELGRWAKSFMDQGQLVPDDVTIAMLKDEWSKHPEAAGFIFDGFPRTSAQAAALDEILADAGTGVTAMIGLEVDDEELVKRLLERGATSGRADDANEEVIRQRLAVYYRETAPVQSYYEAQGKYRGLSGVGSIEFITANLRNLIQSL
ncbi:MAG: adenylate kinase [Schleiferiaceae bacterium]